MSIKSMALAVAAVLLSGAANAEELRVTHFMSPMHHIQTNVLEPMGEDLAKVSDGDLTLRLFPSGELSRSPAAQWRSALTGVSDIAFGLPGYTTAEFPRVMLTMSPSLFKTADQATNTVWDNIDLLKSDFDRAHLLAFWLSEPAVLMTRDVAVHSIADLKGLKIRTADQVAAELLTNWGAVPVPLPASEIYMALDTGVIDGLFIDPSGVPSFRLEEVVKHATLGLPTPSSPFFIVMNKDRYDGLSAEQQAMIDEASGRALSLKSADSYSKEALRGMEILKETGVEIITLDEAQQAEFKAGADAVTAGLSSVAQAAGVSDADEIVAKLLVEK